MGMATLSIDLVAKLASFEQDMGRVSRITEKNAQQMQKALAGVSSTMQTLGAGVSIAATVAFVRGIIDGVDALNDLKDASGSSIENISALENVALRTGTKFEAVSTSLIKFNAALKDGGPDNKIAAALEAIGLKAEDLRKDDPAVALLKTAQALNTFADDGNKARLVQELFGKSLREVAPFLKDLGEQGALVATVTTQQAEEAERFNKQLSELQKNSTDASRVLVSDLVTGLNAGFKAFKEAREENNLFIASLKALNAVFQGSDANQGDRALVDKTNDLLKAQNMLDASRAAGDDPRRVKARQDIVNGLKEEIRVILAYRKAMEPPPETPKPSVGDVAGKPSKVGASKKDTITDAQRALAAYVNELERAIEKDQELTNVQIAQNRLAALGAIGQIPQVRELVLGLAQQRDATKELADREKDLAAYRAKISEINNAYLDRITKDNDALAKNNETMRLAFEEIGLQVQALNALRLARLDSAIAQEEENLVMAKNIEGNEAEITQIERRIRLKKIERGLAAATADRQQQVEEQDASKKRSDSLSQSINDGIVDGFRRGKSAGDIFVDELKAQFGKTILSPIIKPVADFGAGLITSGLGALAGAFGLPKFATGISYVPHDMAAVIHKGERVVTAAENKNYGKSQPTIVLNNNFTVGDVASMAQVQRAVTAGNQKTIAALRRSMSYGGAMA